LRASRHRLDAARAGPAHANVAPSAAESSMNSRRLVLMPRSGFTSVVPLVEARSSRVFVSGKV